MKHKEVRLWFKSLFIESTFITRIVVFRISYIQMVSGKIQKWISVSF